MTNLSSQQIYDIAAAILNENGFPSPRSIWNWSDVFSKDLIEKGIYTNRCQLTIYLTIEGKESISFKIEVATEEEYRKKLNHIITSELKPLVL